MQQNEPNRKTPNLRRALPQYGEGPHPKSPLDPPLATPPLEAPPPPVQVQSAAMPSARVSNTPIDTSLKVDSILTQEFMHASGSAHQLRDHSNGLFNFFLVSAGVMSTGLGVIVNAYKGSGSHTTFEVLQALILMAGSVLGFVIFVRFFKLNEEYRESLLTLNLIKEFYVTHLRREMPEIDRAFRSPLQRVKRDADALSTNTILGFTIAGLGSLSAAGAAGHIIGLISDLNHWNVADFGQHALGIPAFGWESIVFLLAFAAQIQYFRQRLNRPQESIV